MKIRKPSFDIERFNRELLEALPCRHANAIIGKKIKTNGQPYYRMQCADCGKPLSSQISYKKVEELKESGLEVRVWDRNLEIEYNDKYRRASWPIEQRINNERQAIWWSDYNKYLDSEEWKIIKKKVMERAGGICELCKTQKADQVHHLTYERVGKERLEDLKAVCFECHDKEHDGALSIEKMMDELDREFGVGKYANKT